MLSSAAIMRLGPSELHASSALQPLHISSSPHTSIRTQRNGPPLHRYASSGCGVAGSTLDSDDEEGPVDLPRLDSQAIPVPMLNTQDRLLRAYSEYHATYVRLHGAQLRAIINREHPAAFVNIHKLRYSSYFYYDEEGGHYMQVGAGWWLPTEEILYILHPAPCLSPEDLDAVKKVVYVARNAGKNGLARTLAYEIPHVKEVRAYVACQHIEGATPQKRLALLASFKEADITVLHSPIKFDAIHGIDLSSASATS